MLKYNSLKLKLTQVYFRYDRNREEGSGQKRSKKCASLSTLSTHYSNTRHTGILRDQVNCEGSTKNSVMSLSIIMIFMVNLFKAY